MVLRFARSHFHQLWRAAMEASMESMTASSSNHPRKPVVARLRYWLAGVSLVAIGLVAGWQLSGTPTWSAVVDSPDPISAPAGAQARTIGGDQDSYAPIIEKVAPAVVRIDTRGEARQERTQFQDLPPGLREFFGPQFEMPRRPQRGVGSGVIVGADGYIITNNHVVDGADQITVTLSDDREFTGKLVGADPPTDVAVVKIEAKGLPALTFGDSDAARVGDVVLAIGSPLGLDQSASMGIISAKGRTEIGVNVGAGGDPGYGDFLQTDAPINQGNSGGAMVNTRGELIGIPTMILSPSGGNIGVGFAIPTNMARGVMDQLLKTGKVRRARLGVAINDIDAAMAEALNLPSTQGAVVGQVQPDTPAAGAGMEQGDVITAVNGQEVRNVSELRNLIASQQPGSKAKITFLRSGKEQSVTVTLSELETEEQASRTPGGEESESGRLGIRVEPLTPELRTKLKTTRDSGVVVADVAPDSAAGEAGIRPGMVIYEVNKKPVQSGQDVSKAVAAAGDRAVLLTVGMEGSEALIAVKPRG
jgi:serine protease Do